MADSRTPSQPPTAESKEPRHPISMHENVPIWHDCCACEAEPHWLKVAEELGIDLGGQEEEPDATDCDGKEG